MCTSVYVALKTITVFNVYAYNHFSLDTMSDSSLYQTDNFFYYKSCLQKVFCSFVLLVKLGGSAKDAPLIKVVI